MERQQFYDVEWVSSGTVLMGSEGVIGLLPNCPQLSEIFVECS